MIPYSLRLVSPLRSLLARRLRRRWWTHVEAESPADLPDLAERPGRQTFGDGTGDVIRRRYELTFDARGADAAAVMRWFRGVDEAQSPADYARFSEPIEQAGQTVEVELAGPWNGPVEVLEVDEHHVALGTLDGHMEAGWIIFSAEDVDDGRVRFTVTSAAKAGDPAFWLLHVVARVGRWVQADMWASLLEGAATAFGELPRERVAVQTVTHPLADGRQQDDKDTEAAT